MSCNGAETKELGVIDVVRRVLAQRSIALDVSPDDNLSDLGLSSFDMVELVLSVESTFDLSIPEKHITPTNFRSVSSIDALVRSLRG